MAILLIILNNNTINMEVIVILFEPSYMQPYLTDIDATWDNTFSCRINSEGGTSVNAYSLEINGDSMSHTYAKTTLSTPLYNGDTLEIPIASASSQMVNGNDYTWNLTLYEDNPSMWVAYGVIQSDTSSTTTTLYIRAHYNVKSGMYIKISGQTRYISSFDTETGVAILSVALSSAPSAGTEYNIFSDFLTSSDFYFRARKTPVVSITNIPTTVESRSYTFNGSYTQDDGVAWKYFKWILYNSNDEIVEESENINTGLITYTFDGLIDNTTYKIQLLVENQDNVVAQTAETSFNVDYLEPSLITIPNVENLCSKNAIKVSWTQPYINQGVASSEIASEPYYELVSNEPYVDGKSVRINNDCILEYTPSTSVENIDIPYESTIYTYCRLSEGFSGNVIELIDEDSGDYYTVSYEDGYFNYNINNETSGSVYAVEVIEKWLLSTDELYNSTYSYMWIDSERWGDDLIYLEPTNTTLDNTWFKITILPTEIKISAISPEHLNIFYEPNINMNYNTRLYSDYNLNTTDVLYV